MKWISCAIKDKERSHLSQPKVSYYVYGRFVCNMFWSKGTIFRYLHQNYEEQLLGYEWFMYK